MSADPLEERILAMLDAGLGTDTIAARLKIKRSRVERAVWPFREAMKKKCKRSATPADTRSLTGRVFGDPLPGRSALDRRK